MSVVQRCPSCGTTKATSGECEACHDAQVRYFCTNHTPGVWLDSSACPSCGARFGEPERRMSPSAAPAVAKRTRPATRVSRTRRGAPAPTSAAPRPYAPEADEGYGGDDRPAPPGYEDSRPRGASPMSIWLQLLGSAVRARYTPTRGAGFGFEPRIRRRTGGCLKSLLLSVVLLFIALGSVVFLFGRALLGV